MSPVTSHGSWTATPLITWRIHRIPYYVALCATCMQTGPPYQLPRAVAGSPEEC